MSPELQHALGSVMGEIGGRYGESYSADQAKQHLVDRWYRFTEYGVSGRLDMQKVVVTLETRRKLKVPAEFPNQWFTDVATSSSSLTVSVKGSVLEGK